MLEDRGSSRQEAFSLMMGGRSTDTTDTVFVGITTN
jgi:hypothetical protein